jgi:hypothetical protein
MDSLIYLAAPYSHKCPAVREARFWIVNAVAASLFAKGILCYSPISHSHPIYLASNGTIPHDSDIWYRHGMLMAHKCDECYVVTLPGWRESAGVMDLEIPYFKRANKPLDYLVMR